MNDNNLYLILAPFVDKQFDDKLDLKYFYVKSQGEFYRKYFMKDDYTFCDKYQIEQQCNSGTLLTYPKNIDMQDYITLDQIQDVNGFYYRIRGQEQIRKLTQEQKEKTLKTMQKYKTVIENSEKMDTIPWKYTTIQHQNILGHTFVYFPSTMFWEDEHKEQFKKLIDDFLKQDNLQNYKDSKGFSLKSQKFKSFYLRYQKQFKLSNQNVCNCWIVAL